MNYNKKSVLDAAVSGKKVLLRCDFNVPQNKETGEITSDKRIKAALPTIKYLLDNGAAVIACSHLGKPKGEWKPKLSLAPVAEHLSKLLDRPVIFANDIIGEDAKAKAAALKPGEIMLLQNLRYDIREEKNDPEFAKELVKNGTTRLILSHLSQENNTPDIARQTTLCALNEAGFEENVDFKLVVSPEENYERPIVL